MAHVFWKGITDGIAVAADPMTLVQIVAAANHGVLIHQVVISIDPDGESEAIYDIDCLTQTTAGTMSALTLVKTRDDPETLEVSAQHTATAEPTAGSVVERKKVSIGGTSPIEVRFNFTGNNLCKVSGGNRFGVRINRPGAETPICTVSVLGEE